MEERKRYNIATVGRNPLIFSYCNNKIEFGGPRCASPVVDYGQTECQVSVIFGEMQHNETIPVDCYSGAEYSLSNSASSDDLE